MQDFATDVEGVERAEEVKDEAWERLCRALKTDTKSIDTVRRADFARGVTKLTFLLVLTGCELDLYGFGMAYSDYWALDKLFIKFLLITGPLGYVLACILYLVYSGEVERRQQEERQKQPRVVSTKQPVKLRFYHFVPLFRYVLVVKDKELDDVEGLFRVNSLSSFSLGIAQICGIIFTGLATNWKLTLFSGINIASQVINWSITIMYFVTPVATKMGNAMKVDALADNSQQRLQRLLQRYDAAVKHQSPRSQSKDQLERGVEREILSLANIRDLDLSPFSVKRKIQALKFLQWQNIQTYAEI